MIERILVIFSGECFKFNFYAIKLFEFDFFDLFIIL